jgi:hypothetical protein
MSDWDLLLEQEAELAALVGKAAAEDEAAKPSLYRQAINISTIGTNIIVSGRQGYQIAIHELIIFNTIDQTVRLLDGTIDMIGPLVGFAAGAGLTLPYHDQPHFLLDHGNNFSIDLSAGQLTGYVQFRYIGVS